MGMELSIGTVFIRLFVAFVLGGVIGIEREIRNQPAGFRTHAILAVGSALLMMLSYAAALKYGVSRSSPGDPTRIASQVVSGIGFLGAGAILRMGPSVKGLTTAASLWTTAAIGLAVGGGFYAPAVIATGLLLLALWLLGRMEKRFLFTKPRRALFIEAVDEPTLMGDIERVLDSLGYNMDFVEIDRDSKQCKVDVQMVIRPKLGVVAEEDPARIVKKLLDIPEVSNVEIR